MLIVFSIVLIIITTAYGEKKIVSYRTEKEGIVKVIIITTGISTVVIEPDQLLLGYNYVTNPADTQALLTYLHLIRKAYIS